MAVLAEVGADAHPNATFVVEAHLRLQAGDIPAIRERIFAPDILWHEFGPSGLAGSYAGVDAVLVFWKEYFGAAGKDFSQDILVITANDEYVTSIVAMRGAKPGATLDQTAVDVMRLADGRIAEFWRYYADVAQAHAYFAAAH